MDSSQTTQILLVEDDKDDSFLLMRQLAKAQIDDHVTVMGNGKEALDFLLESKTTPLLILLDLKLPGLSGLQLLEKLRQEPRLQLTPVVVMTGSSNPKDVEKCTELGVTDYLSKPISLRSFIKTVTSVFPAAVLPEENL